MAFLQVYRWEHDTWPTFQTVKVDRMTQRKLIKKLARHFKVDEPSLEFSRQRGANVAKSETPGAAGKYIGGWHPRIKLGTVTTLGTLVHEFAHHLNYRRWASNGHGRTFKRELKRTYTFTKRYLPEVVLEPRGERPNKLT